MNVFCSASGAPAKIDISNRRRLARFLEGISDVLGRANGAGDGPDDLATNAALQQRLRSLLTGPAAGARDPATDSTRTSDPLQHEAIERHSELGERLVRPLCPSDAVASAIRHHHERWDGSGYPDGLAGDDIPLASRIIAIADSFDAMTFSQPCRLTALTELTGPVRNAREAITELRKEAGQQFDPELAESFVSLLAASAYLSIEENES
jgi:hypothetical protein